MRVFSGGMVNEDSTFSNMREQYARFETPPSFGDLVDRLKVMMNVDSTESAITLRGWIDSGRGLAHYMLYPIPNEDEWLFYTQCVKESQVCCAEVVVEISRNSSGAIGDGVHEMGEESEGDPMDNLTQDHVNQEIPCLGVEEVQLQGEGRVSMRSLAAQNCDKFTMAVVNNDFAEDTFGTDDSEDDTYNVEEDEDDSGSSSEDEADHEEDGEPSSPVGGVQVDESI